MSTSTTPKDTSLERRKLSVSVLVETAGDEEQVNRTIQWVANQIKDSVRWAKGSSIAIGVRDDDKDASLGFSLTGPDPSSELKESISELLQLHENTESEI